MKHAPRILALALLASPVPAAHAQAQETVTAAVPGAAPYNPQDPWVWGDVALLRGLDKVTAETRDFEARVGQDVEFFALTVSVKRCAKRPPEMTPETIVGMEVYDRRTDGGGAQATSERIFSGWMFGSSPALNPLEHPVYDVWVLDCYNSQTRAAEQAAAAAQAPTPPPATLEGPAPGEVLD